MGPLVIIQMGTQFERVATHVAEKRSVVFRMYDFVFSHPCGEFGSVVAERATKHCFHTWGKAAEKADPCDEFKP